MLKKAVTILMLLPAIIALAACSSLPVAGAQPAATTAAKPAQAGQGQNPPSQPLESKLAMGTLKLEGTAQAVTAEQAKALLPLWKAAKSLSASSTASGDEQTALYQQIQEAMTAEQVQAIQDLTMSQADIQALMKQYGIEAPAAGSFPTPSAAQQATRQAQRSAAGNSGASSGANSGANGAVPGGDFGPGGGMPPDGAGFGGGQGAAASGQPNAQGTPVPGQANRGPRGGMTNLFIDPLIKVLQERAGVTSGS